MLFLVTNYTIMIILMNVVIITYIVMKSYLS